MKPALSVVIPCLNEAVTLSRLLSQLAAQKNLQLEVLVADGGSTDSTIATARAGSARIVTTARGRARQMNAGARASTADWLLFLHADSRIEDPGLLANALKCLQGHADRVAQSRVAGHFSLKFYARHGHDMAWRYVEEKTAFNRRYCTNGDQGLLLARRYFEELGGFDDTLPLLEDQRIAERIRETGHFITLPGVLYSSARRFTQSGFHRQYLLMALIMAMHSAGAREYFTQASSIYGAQHEGSPSRLLPYFQLARACTRRIGHGRVWMSIGRLGRENWWQLFYFIDIASRRWIGPGHYPSLHLYERWIEPLTGNRLCDGIAAGVLWLHFHVLVLPWAWLSDLRQPPVRTDR